MKVEEFRACGICERRDIPFGVDWPTWVDGSPAHPICAAMKMGAGVIDLPTPLTSASSEDSKNDASNATDVTASSDIADLVEQLRRLGTDLGKRAIWWRAGEVVTNAASAIETQARWIDDLEVLQRAAREEFPIVKARAERAEAELSEAQKHIEALLEHTEGRDRDRGGTATAARSWLSSQEATTATAPPEMGAVTAGAEKSGEIEPWSDENEWSYQDFHRLCPKDDWGYCDGHGHVDPTTDIPSKEHPCERCGGCGCGRPHVDQAAADFVGTHSGVCPSCQGSGLAAAMTGKQE